MISHESIEKNLGLLIVLTILVVSVGGLVQIVPLFFQTSTTTPVTGLKPYTALQLAGRDIYIREGCVGCHSQMVRPFRAETERYGHAWHTAHLMNPRDVVPESNMPAYPWLDRPLKDAAIQDKMRTLNIVGHGYTEQEIATAPAALEGKTELQALIAFLQVLGTLLPPLAPVTPVGSASV